MFSAVIFVPVRATKAQKTERSRNLNSLFRAGIYDTHGH